MEQMQTMSLFERLKRNGRTADGSVSFLSEWDAVQFIDRGAFGVVYEIVKTNGALGEQHSALKIIEMDEISIRKYKDEIAALNSIRNHPHAVSIEDYSEVILNEGDFVRRYLIIRMELLRSMPKTGMSEDEVIKMGIEVSNVLADCHSRKPKILHCDIKPPNILLTENGTYKLSDFGEAKFLDKSRGSSGMRGTPFYMAPEMFRMEGYDERCDLYSLGITMYAMLGGGKVPFHAEGLSDNEIVRKRLTGAAFPRIKGVRPELLRIISKLCEMDPDKRYQKASMLGRDLHALVKKKEDEARKREEAEVAERLRAKQRADKERQRQEDRLKRLNAQKDAIARREAQIRASLENPQGKPASVSRSSGETMVMGATVTAEQREQLLAEMGGRSSAKQKLSPAVGKLVKILVAVACAAVVITGAVFGGVAIVEQQRLAAEEQRIAEEQRLAEEQRIAEEQLAEEQKALLEPKTEADRALAEKFSFELIDGGVVLAKYKGAEKEVEIPAEYNGMSVVKIGKYAFNMNKDITSVTIPYGVTEIGLQAFSNCGSLKSITISDSVKSIGNYAFFNCRALKSVTIPESVTNIGKGAFTWCFRVTIKAPHDESYYNYIDSELYSYEGSTWVVTD